MDEEDKAFAKCAWRLIPFMALLYLVNYIDRVNVGFAKSFLIGHAEDRVCQPSAERLVVLELLKELGVVLEHRGDHSFERLVVLDAGVLPVRILPGVLVGWVS